MSRPEHCEPFHHHSQAPWPTRRPWAKSGRCRCNSAEAILPILRACYNSPANEPETPMRANDGTRTAAEVLIDQLVIHGVRHAFCVPCESYIAALDAFHDRDIAVTVCRQESGAAIMAEA